MSQTQKIIIPRNWLFGRLCFCHNNLKNIVCRHPKNFTLEEYDILLKIDVLYKEIINNKKKNSELLKQSLK